MFVVIGYLHSSNNAAGEFDYPGAARPSSQPIGAVTYSEKVFSVVHRPATQELDPAYFDGRSIPPWASITPWYRKRGTGGQSHSDIVKA
jgi:hypothetical protein